MQPIIETRSLKKTFYIKKNSVEAVKGVDLVVYQGEIFGFLGPNGAGKTTTLRMLTTLLPVEDGDALVAGHSIKTHPHEVRKHIGFVSQQGGADKSATGYENLVLQAQLYGMTTKAAQAAAEKVIEDFALRDCIMRFVQTYSGGQRRRLDVAMGIIHAPKVLFLDEPTTGLDPQNRFRLWRQLKDLQKQGITIFITSHYLDEIDFLADRLAIMDQGNIIEVGTPSALKKQIATDVIHLEVAGINDDAMNRLLSSQPYIKRLEATGQHWRLYVEEGTSALTQLLRLLDQEKVSVKHISLAVPTLDDVFLQKTGHSLRE